MFEVRIYQDGYVIESDTAGVVCGATVDGMTRPIFSRDLSYMSAVCAVLNSADAKIAEHDEAFNGKGDVSVS